MSSAANPVTSGSNTQNSTSNPVTSLSGASDPLANEETFLQLLVSQLQNQDPMNPPDTNEFITQLTGYSQLEQLINIHSDADTLVQDAGSTTSGTSGSGNPGTGGSDSTGAAPSGTGATASIATINFHLRTNQPTTGN